jgi:hypothetical protein
LGAQTFTIVEHQPVVSATVQASANLRHVTLTGTYTDTAAEPHQLVVSWGDGKSTLITLGVAPTGPFISIHTYKGKPGVHRQIELYALDDEGTKSNVLVLNVGRPPRKVCGGRR